MPALGVRTRPTLSVQGNLSATAAFKKAAKLIRCGPTPRTVVPTRSSKEELSGLERETEGKRRSGATQTTQTCPRGQPLSSEAVLFAFPSLAHRD